MSTSFQEPIPRGWNKDALVTLGSAMAGKLRYPTEVTLQAAIKQMGGKIQRCSWEDATKMGQIEIRKKQNFTIFLNPLHIGECLLTIANGLGHYMLHSNVGEKPMRIGHNPPDSIAREARWFALGLLMPETELRNEINKGKKTAGLAEHFNVTQTAAHLRQERKI